MVVEKSSTDTPEVEASKDRRAELLADIYTMPSVNAAAVIKSAHTYEDSNPPDYFRLIDNLRNQINQVNNDDLSRPEAMLISQAHTLDTLFGSLAQRSIQNMGDHFNTAERLMRLALKAQGQCSTTLKVLGELKNPKQVSFVKQANIANGHQQINNSVDSGKALRTEKQTKNQPNELLELEAQDGERLDFGAQTAPEASNSTVEALVAVNRSNNA